MRRRWFAAATVSISALTACGGGQVGSTVLPSVSPSGRALTYVAMGASETVGIGADHPQAQAWPQVFYRTALPRAAILVNLGVPGSTAARAVRDQLPIAIAVKPDVATVFLNVNDIVDQVPVSAYRADLEMLLEGLRSTGARVLVANVPPLDQLPLLKACLPFAPGPDGSCDTSRRISVEEIDRIVDDFNGAIASVASATGAILVDLHGAGLKVREAGGEASIISSDGFHPSTAGHELIARTFAAALRRAFPGVAVGKSLTGVLSSTGD
jgi:acyl-CoA thioesterase I